MTRLASLLSFGLVLACQSRPEPALRESQPVENSGLRGVVLTVDRLE